MLLPGVKPWVQNASNEIETRFHPVYILGIGLRADNPNSDHPKGLAADYGVGKDRVKGDQIATYLVANAARLGITYVIWYARIWEPGKGWTAYAHPSGGTSLTQLHMDHVHASFRASFVPGGTAPTEVQGFGGGLADIGSSVKTIFEFVTDPHTYLRAGMLIVGIVLLIIGLFSIDKVKRTAQGVSNAIA